MVAHRRSQAVVVDVMTHNDGTMDVTAEYLRRGTLEHSMSGTMKHDVTDGFCYNEPVVYSEVFSRVQDIANRYHLRKFRVEINWKDEKGDLVCCNDDDDGNNGD